MKILEVTNIDLYGRRFNGFDLINDFKNNKRIDISQAVVNKLSNDKNVVTLLNNNNLIKFFNYFKNFENEVLSVHNVMSITTPALFNLEEYKKADIIHIHMLHNSNFSLYTLEKISQEKKVIYSIHDPWPLTGRCVHFYDCDLWKTGCYKCNYLYTAFPLKHDNCDVLWNYKKRVFSNPNINVVYTTEWMKKNVENSLIMSTTKKHYIPLGIDMSLFKNTKKSRKRFGISDDEVVLFFRAQREFKGTNYIIEAMKKIIPNMNITLLTCSEKGLLSELKDEYKIIELGQIKDSELIDAYNACDIFLMPSTGESFGYMAIEAMACSKPVIVFDNTALPSTTKAPEIGVLVKNLDSDDLAEKIGWLVNNKKERIRRGKEGRKFIEQKYGYQKYLKKIEELYINVYNSDFIDYKKIKIDDDSENINNIKNMLNIFTKKYFRRKSRMYKDLMFEDISKLTNKKIEYCSNTAVKLVDDYTKIIYNYLSKDSDDIKLFYKIKTKLRNLIINIKEHGIVFVAKNIIKKIRGK